MSKKTKASVQPTDGTNALAILNNAAANDRAAFVVMGGDLITPSVYRSSLERTWQQSMSGISSKSVRAEAYGISAAAYAATNYRAQVLSDTPVGVCLKTGGESDWNPVPYFLSTLPTLSWFIEATLIIYGVCYLRKVYNDFGYPSGLEWIHPDDVTPQTDVKGNVEEYYIDAQRYMPFQMVEIRTFDPQRTLDGKSEFEVALSRMTTEQAIVRHAGSFFFNSARPDGLLLSKTPLNKQAQSRAEQDWKKFKGSKNAWKTFVSSGQWEWIPLTGAPVDLAMVDLSTKNDRDILAIMRVNPALLGFADVSDPLSAGSTLKEIKKNHILDVTIPRYNWILRHLNEQWLYPDFGHGDLYRLEVNQQKMKILADLSTDTATTAQTLSGGTGVVADFNELRNQLGLPDREGYITRSPTELNTIFLNSGITLDEYRTMLGLEPFGFFGGDLVRLASGAMVKMSDLPKAAAAMLQTLIQGSLPPPAPLPPASNAPQFIMPPSGFGGGGSAPALPPPAPATPPALPPGGSTKSDLTKLARLILKSSRSGGATNEAAVLLSFPGNKQIQALQTIMSAYSNPAQPPPEYTDPEDYHITLVMAESLTPQAEQALYELLADMPPVELETADIGTFPPGEDGLTPVVLFLADNEPLKTLRGYQAALVNKIMEAEPGAVLSDFSQPDAWQPHITLAYVMGDYASPPLKAPLPIVPTCLELSRKVYEVTYSAPALPPTDSPPPEVATSPAEPGNRAASSIALSLVWPENNFLIMASRMAAEACQSAGVSGVEWSTNRDYSLTLSALSGTPGQANSILNNFEPGENARMELMAYAFQIVGRSIYLMCDPAEGLNKLRASVGLQLEDAGFKPEDGEFIPGIYLGQLTTDDPNALMDAYNALNAQAPKLGMRLEAGNIDLVVNGQSRTSWALRSHTPIQKDELNMWKRKATGKGADKSFNTSALRGSLVESFVRAALEDIDPDDLPAVNDVFNRAKRVLTNGVDYIDLPDAPEEYQAYWDNFDKLDHNLGAAWLKYMEKAAPSVLAMLATDTNPTSIYAPLAKFHDELSNEWIGTPEEPGDLVKIVLAGMAAGNESLKGAVNMNPTSRAFGDAFKAAAGATPRPPTFTGIGVTVDWDLLNQEAYDFARQYSYNLIKGLDQTTQKLVQNAFGDWLKSGEPQTALKDSLKSIFKDPNRADSIGETESIRIYNEGAFKRWADVGVTKAVWRTVQDPKVCPICRPLNGQIADVNAGWIHPGGNYIDPYDNQRVNGDAFRGKVYKASAHTRCRCYRRPVVIYDKPNVPAVDPQTETVSKTRFAGQKIDAVLSQLDKDFEPIRTKLREKTVKLADMTRQANELKTQNNKLANTLTEMWGTRPKSSDPAYADFVARYQKLFNEYDGIRKQYKTLDAQREKEAARARKVVLKDIVTPAPYEAKTVPYSAGYKPATPSAAMIKKADDATDFIRSVMDGEQYTDSIAVPMKRKAGRSYHSDGEITMSPSVGTSVYVHEIGHAIELKYPDVHDRCIEFLKYRAGNEETQRLKDIYPNSNYENHEITYKDRFDNAYEGKVYPKFRASELLSMGMQYMYEDAAGFAARDPEYFNFILGIMRRAT